mgnify:CR=1 FL=1
MVISQKKINLMVRDKKAFVFDWDGTLFDSMTGKIISFSNVVSTYFAELSRKIFKRVALDSIVSTSQSFILSIMP